MRRFPEPVLLVSDIDGTLLTKNYHIPPRNITAIRRFQQEGGLFTVATGRSIESGRDTIRLVEPNAPCIVLNGGMLCTFATKHTIWSCPLPPAGERMVRGLYRLFPGTAIELFTKSDIYLLRGNRYSSSHLERSGVRGLPVPEEKWPPAVYKALLMDDEDKIAVIRRHVAQFPDPELRFFPSSAHYLEMVPARVNKGAALQKLRSLLGIRQQNTFAIGDYDNDLEMIQSAYLGAAPQNAIDEIKASAQLTVCDCADGAVADFIAHIESMYHLHNS